MGSALRLSLVFVEPQKVFRRILAGSWVGNGEASVIRSQFAVWSDLAWVMCRSGRGLKMWEKVEKQKLGEVGMLCRVH